MVGAGLYLGVAVVVAVAILVGAEWVRDSDAHAPCHPGIVGVCAGLLWPLLAIGVLELIVVAAAGVTPS